MRSGLWKVRRWCGYLLLLCAVFGLVVFVRAARQRLSHYRYDTSQDMRLDFTRADPRKVVARLKDGVVVVPARQAASDVVLLAVRVRASWLGRWLEPEIDISDGVQERSQAFERGGSGLRFFNLSGFDLNSERTLSLRAKHASLADQEGTLYYLHSDIDPARQVTLILSPHPDDAEIAAYGMYAGRNAYVVTITAGEAGDAGMFALFGGKEAFAEKGRARAWNSVAVPMLGSIGAERVANLGYFDGTLSAMRAHPDTAVHSQTTAAGTLDTYRHAGGADLIPSRANAAANWTNLVGDLRYLIDRLKPDIIVTPSPVLDAHPDHQMTTVALIEALHLANARHGSLLLYSNHSFVSELYPYGPRGDIVSVSPAAPNVAFDGLWSNELSRQQQDDKYVALDAMNDLRPDLRDGSMFGAWRYFEDTLKASLYADDERYFRRAVRADEFFYEVRIASLEEPGMVEKVEGGVSSIR